MNVSLPMPTLGRPVPTPAAGCNCAVCDFFIDNPAALEPVCSGSSSSCEYCGCARAEAVTPTEGPAGACSRCPIRCGSRPDIASWMRDIGGTLHFTGLTVPGTLPELPAFIPQVDGHDVPGLDAQLQWPAYAIGLRRVLSPKSHKVYPRYAGKTVHQALGLRPEQKAVLVGYAEDPLVEAYWTRRKEDGIAETLAAQEWDLVLTPNTSMYFNQPRAENLINMRRNVMLAAELADAGVPAVPCVYWLRLEDLDRYIDWIDDSPITPPALAVNLQTFRTQADWEEMAVPGLAYLAATLPEDIPMVLTGASRADRIATLQALFPGRLYLVSQNPLQYARHGAVMTHQGRVDTQARTEDLFTANVRHYAELAGITDPSGGKRGIR
ncbi:hypothetical protein [Streptomyces aureoversilis]|uniref:DUF4417 domain-containing protein n=1 Tax=Streptomyces aureoversilis TaxID=67277 RepID=A0ABW0A8W3_9ACTN